MDTREYREGDKRVVQVSELIEGYRDILALEPDKLLKED